jgi:hypothetical protein
MATEINSDTISSKKELLLEQIENYERSGYFTEKEIDRLCSPIKLELQFLEMIECHNNLSSISTTTIHSFEEFKGYFLKIGTAKKPINAINVIDAEILTPTNTQA